MTATPEPTSANSPTTRTSWLASSAAAQTIVGALSGIGGWFQSLRHRRAIVAGACALLLGVAVISGTGFTTKVLDNSDDTAWLLNNNGSASHASAITGDVDYRVTFTGAAGDDLAIVQRTDGVYLLNRTSGEFARVDESLMRLNAGGVVPQSAGLSLFVGNGATYVVDVPQGVVYPVDPTTLQQAGDPVTFPSGFSSAIVDPSGALLVAPAEQGVVIALRNGEQGEPIRIGETGQTLELVSVNHRPVAVNLTTMEFAAVTGDGRVADPQRIDGLDPAADIVFSASEEQPLLWLLSRTTGELQWVNPANGATGAFSIDARGDTLARPVVNGSTVYVPEPAKARVLAYTADGRQLPSIPVPPQATNLETFVKGGRLWVNDPDSGWAANVDAEGQVIGYDKYTKNAPTSEITDTTDDAAPQFDGSQTPPATVPVGQTAPAPPPVPFAPADSFPVSPPISGTPGLGQSGAPPGSPSEIAAKPGDQALFVSFNRAPENSRAVGYYEITTKPDAGTTERVNADANQWGYKRTIDGLQNGTQYTVTVTAFDDQGERGGSATAIATPQSGVPDPPTNITVDDNMSEALAVTWDPPEGAQIQSYLVLARTGSGGENQKVPVTGATAVTIVGLTNGADYRISVIAVAADGTESEPATSEGQYSPFTTPEAPGRPDVTPTDGGLDVTWTPGDNGGRKVQSYLVEYTSAQGQSKTVTVDRSAAQLKGLTNGESYGVRVQARTQAGDSPWSPVEWRAPRTQPNAPESPNAPAGDGYVTLSWSPPDGGAEPTGYQLYVNGKLQGNVSANQLTERFNGLTNGQEYTFGVATLAASGLRSETVTVTATPTGPPQLSVAAGNATASSVAISTSVRWQGNSESGECSAQISGRSPISVSCNGTATFDGLEPNTRYTVTVTARNGTGLSDEASITVRTAAAPQPKPAGGDR
jgi:fibronectin type 3 domain-containing protein